MSIGWTIPTRFEPADYTWSEFRRAFEVACTDAWDENPGSDPTITLPYSVFPEVVAMVNPLTGRDLPIIRISPFGWRKP